MFLALAVAAVGGFMAASCGNSSNKGDMGTSDMNAAPPDLVVAKLNCEGVGTCTYNCVLSGQGDLGTCAQVICAKTAKAGSVNKWVAAVICGQTYCEGDMDMKTGSCLDQKFTNDMGAMDILCDSDVTLMQCQDPAYVSKKCTPCLTAARNFWFIDESVDPMNPGPPTFMCPDPANADCIAAKTACATTFNACTNDL